MLVVPEEQSALHHLEVIRIEAPGKVGKEGLADLGQLVRAEQLQNLLQLIEEEDLLPAAAPGPVFEEALEDRRRRVGILLDILDDAVGKLLVIQTNALGLVKGDERPNEKLQVLLLQRDRKAVDNGAQNFKQLANTVVTFGLIDEAVEHVRDGPADKGSVRHELAVDSVENSLEIVPLPRIFAVEQLHELEAEALIDILFGRLGIDLGTHDEAKEELIRDLQMRPSGLQHRFVLLGIKVVRGRREGAANIGRYHRHQVRHNALGEDLLAGGGVDVINEFQQRLTLHILAPLVGAGVIK
mmetsp:Transcript_9117/g.25675  ORF Transcript_9117/g.25675 Transcript_9117/m.25675 type:complete len:298 (+) Transcript_9117:457-1350(+)